MHAATTRPFVLLLALAALGLAGCAAAHAQSGGTGELRTDDRSAERGKLEPVDVAVESLDDGPIEPGTSDDDVALAQLASCDDVRTYMTSAIVEQLVNNYYGWGWGWGWGPMGGLDDARGAEASPAAAGSGSTAGDAGPSSYTTTNVQEQGVDELDFVKTDGKFVYVVHGSQLSIVRSWPAEAAGKLATLDLPGYGQSMFLAGDRLMVATQVYNGYTTADGKTLDVPFASGSATRLSIVDISDRTKPTLERTLDVEGWLVNGRMVGDDAYLVTQHTYNAPSDLWNLIWQRQIELPALDWNGPPQEQQATRHKARAILYPLVAERLATEDIASFFPQMRSGDGDTFDAVEPLAACNAWMRPDGPPQTSTLSVSKIELDDLDEEPEVAGVYGSGWQVYASTENLYISQSNQWGGWWWGVTNWDPRLHVHKFALEGSDGGPEYRASGKVDGWMLNQFSMSEHEGFLRVATTTNDAWAQDGTQLAEPGNNLFVLEEKAGRLNVVGSVRGLAPGEQIYSARMLGERGYVVTFRQVDPLFTLDLSDPRNPRVVGELKIPGYSSYLHPMDADHLLAVGMDGTETGQLTGFQVSIFDVSDPEKPTLVQKQKIGDDRWGWSEAMWDHHAFTYQNGVLAIPSSYTKPDGTWFSGLTVLDVDPEEGISERGQVSHTDLASDACIAQTVQWGGDTRYCGQYNNSYWYAQMRRSIFIDESLISISSAGLKVSELSDPDEVIATVFLPTTW